MTRNDSSAGRPPGRIITFFSYKGGTGRSMALANIAWVLASAGQRVLMMDWDFEAPGLHRYVHPFLSDPELVESPGLIEFFLEFAGAAISPIRSQEDQSWFQRYKDPLNYTISVDFEFPKVGGRQGYLDLIPAGRQDAHYSLRVNGFNWDRFYTAFGGGIFLEAVKEHLRKEYDYILIDSRTGVSDTAGICTVQMPDHLVACFTLNRQSIAGCAAVARSAISQRGRPDGSASLCVWPVPTRIEDAEKQKRDRMLAHAIRMFENSLSHLRQDLRERYWGEIGIRYQPFYAYEEVLAVFGDRPHMTGSMLASIEAITRYLTNGAVSELAPMAERFRQNGLERFQGPPSIPSAKIESARDTTPVKEGKSIYVSYAHSDRDASDEHLAKFFADLGSELRIMSGEEVSLWRDTDSVGGGDDWMRLLETVQQNASAVLALVSPNYLRSEWCLRELMSAQSRGLPILPILWVPVAADSLPSVLRHLSSAPQFDDVYAKQGLRRMMQLRRHDSEYFEMVTWLARRVAEIARSGDAAILEDDTIREQVRALAKRYQEFRGNMPTGSERTARLDEIAAQMRAIAGESRRFLPELMASNQAGDRLAAIAILQIKPADDALDWLAARVDPQAEQAFIGYNAAVALRIAAKMLPIDDLAIVERSIFKGLESIVRKPNSNRDRTLRIALKELEQRRNPAHRATTSPR